MHFHNVNDRASYEMASRIASELPRRPEWIELARANLRRWKQGRSDDPSTVRNCDEWLEILKRPVAEVCAILTAPTDEGQRLRSNTPFAGTLAPREVWSIKKRVRNETV